MERVAIPGEGNSNLLQYSYLENSKDRGVLWSTGSQRVRHDLSDLARTPIFKWSCFLIIETSKRSLWGFLDGSVVKNPPAMQEIQETQVQSWGQEDPLKKEMATHSTILAWEFPCTEEHGRLQSKGSQRVRCN